MSEVASYIVATVISVGIPAIVATLWRISLALNGLTSRVDAIERQLENR